eukprot:TRINITY_DN5699_c0_g1_i1.p2 TRINITY_DN5699_c0_g1~~TRINITY_DN5699_c0_g1_i1.p2  ORF type:complete len:358 (-),score=83.97 TRINITY_DN5699_c0_g1_i1:53-1126(-)
MGGIKASNLSNIIFQIDGTIAFSDDIDAWPTYQGGQVLECFEFSNFYNVTFTSKSRLGLLNGRGAKWWGIPGIGFLLRGENRPRLFNIGNSQKILVEYLYFLDSPYWTFWGHEMDGLEVRYCNITAKRNNFDGHDFVDLSAFNTDGFDVTGRNVWIHDSSVWNQDDCFCVKDGSENMLFENLSASGLGLTIGSIGGSNVRNITFRNVHMPQTFKGIYLKFRNGGGNITDILYENIVMDEPEQWPIWIGPAQQTSDRNPCSAGPCSLCWPDIPFAKCDPVFNGFFGNITLRNVTINRPKKSAGVIMGPSKLPMQNIVFDGVVVNDAPSNKDNYYECEGVTNGLATGGTNPVPYCFKSN